MTTPCYPAKSSSRQRRRLCAFVIYAAVLLALAIGAGAFGADEGKEFLKKIKVPEYLELLTEVPFGTGGERTLAMDIVRLKENPDTPMPVLVFIHGGGWAGGFKEQGVPGLMGFAKRGYFCASIEYRLSGEAIFPAQIEDVKCAIRYLRAHSDQYNIDPDRIGVFGTSAGGHLAALLGTSADAEDLEGDGGWQEYSSRVQAVCDLFGPTDLLKAAATSRADGVLDHSSPNSPGAHLLGGPILERKELAERANPITYVSEDDPPFLIMHGDADRVVPYNQSELLYDALTKAGVEATLHILPDTGHGGGAFSKPKWHKEIVDFFDTHLKPEE